MHEVKHISIYIARHPNEIYEFVYNPMRVIPNGNGSEFIFTLMRQPDMSQDQFDDDKRAIEKDLSVLKELLEARSISKA